MKKYAVWVIGLALIGCDFNLGASNDPAKDAGEAQDEVEKDPSVGNTSVLPAADPKSDGSGATKPGIHDDKERCFQVYEDCLQGADCDAAEKCKPVLEACLQDVPNDPPPCAADACYAKYKQACANDFESKECAGLLQQCRAIEQKCGEPAPPPACDAGSINACFTKYKDACGLTPQVPGCPELLKDCEQQQSSCNPDPKPEPNPECPADLVDGCYTKYKLTCGETPNVAGCPELLKECNVLAERCRVVDPPPAPCAEREKECLFKAESICTKDPESKDCAFIREECARIGSECSEPHQK